MAKRMTTEDWIAKARAKHGDRYDYSEVVYVKAKTNVWITCNECGNRFDQRPDCHASNGSGCPACGEAKPMDGKEWIAKAKAKHGEGRYDYREVVYVNSKTKVRITCNDCGHRFVQTPDNHASKGAGCSICGGNKKPTTEEWIEKAKAKHGEGRYDYSEVVYLGTATNVWITCNDCGHRFSQTPKNHVSHGSGCPACVGKKKLTPDEWVSRARDKHGDRYDYSEVEYIDSKTKVWITCNDCGHRFDQNPSQHAGTGQGCPLCSESKMNRWGKELAEDMELAHKPEYKDKTCKDKDVLKFDLAIFDHYEVKVLCEFQGRQHYEPQRFSCNTSEEEAEQKLKDQQRRDQIKRDWCSANNIPLIDIHYSFKDKGEQAFKDELRRQLKSVGIC